MKKVSISVVVFSAIFLTSAGVALAYDATGLWDYSEVAGSHWNNCLEPNPVHSTDLVGILQTGNSFLIVGNGFSKIGSVNGVTYTYSDSFCEDGGVTSINFSATLSSATSASGNVSWTWSGFGESCSGGFQLTINKRPQNTPIYDASGKWNFTQSEFDINTCASNAPPRPSGYFQVTQTGNYVTALDDKGVSYSGFIDGATYALVRSYLEQGGRTSVVYLVTLNSADSGSGPVEFVWDDSCDDCWGQWNIAITKESAAQQKALPGIPLLLLDD